MTSADAGPPVRHSNEEDSDAQFPSDAHPGQQHEHIRATHDCYPVEDPPRGRALVITMTANRSGWDADVKALKELFQSLGTDATWQFDLSREKLLEELKHFAGDPKNVLTDYLLIILMGHGGRRNNKDFMQTADGQELYVRDALSDIFDNNKHKPLQDKPKLFLCQMCRTSISDEADTRQNHQQTGPVEADASKKHSGQVAFTDYILCFTSQPDNLSYRNEESGAWYIQEVCRVFTKHANDTQVFSMLEKVNATMKKKKYFQLGEFISTLSRPFFLFLPRTATGLPREIKIKVAKNYLAKYRSIILWGSGVNPQNVTFDAIYTDMAWKVTHSTDMHEDEKVLKHYTDMLQRGGRCPNRRICIWADAGIGKTVFITKLCQDWALVTVEGERNPSFSFTREQKHTLSNMSEDVKRILHGIKLVACIILRDTKGPQTIINMIQSQLELNVRQTENILKYLDERPADILLAFDGLDEINIDTEGELFKLLSGKLRAEVAYVVTCRPFASQSIKFAVDAQVELKGFNELQAKSYILAYYMLKDQTTPKEQLELQSSALWEEISKSQELLEMASNPSVLQLICFLKLATGHIPKERTEVYKDYVNCLLSQYHSKQSASRFKLKMYHDNLMMMGSLALSGLKQSHLQLIYVYDDIVDKQGRKPFEMGFLTELPTSQCSEQKAQFIHKSLQEYLAAYFIVNSPPKEGVEYLMEFCSTSSNMMSSQMIVSFISSMSSSMGKIVQKKLKNMISEWTEQDDVSPADRLAFLYTMLKGNRNLTFPLPGEIDLSISDYEASTYTIWYKIKRFFSGKSTLERLLAMDGTGVKKAKILVGGISRLGLLVSCKWKHLLHLDLNFAGSTVEGDAVGKLITNCPNMQLLALCECTLSEEDSNQILSHMPHITKISTLQLTKNRIEGSSIGEVIKRCPALQSVDLSDSIVSSEAMEQMLANMPDSSKVTMKQPVGKYITGKKGAAIGKLLKQWHHFEHSLDLNDYQLSGEDLCQLAASMPPSTNITTVQMNGNYLAAQGAGVGQLVNRCPDLRSLDLGGCDLTEEAVEQMVANMPRSTNITALSLASNDRLQWAGVGQLVNHCPDLRSLDLGHCELTVEAVEQIVANMPHSPNITALSLANNIRLQGGEAALGRLLQRLPGLQQLEVRWCWLRIPALLRATGRDALTNMRFLDLGRNSDPQLEVSGYLASMPRLQALSVAACLCDNVQYLLHLVASLPPSLTHLDVHYNDFRPSVVKVLQHKERLARLHRLNIGRWNQDDKVRPIREELQRLNPQLLVYWEGGERLWDMYKDSTHDT